MTHILSIVSIVCLAVMPAWSMAEGSNCDAGSVPDDKNVNGQINSDGFDVLYGSGVEELPGSTYDYRYCIRNNLSYSVTYFHWGEAAPNTLFRGSAAAGSLETSGKKLSWIAPTNGNKELKLGFSESYTSASNVPTIYASNDWWRDYLILAEYNEPSIQDVTGVSWTDALQDTKSLRDYLDFAKEKSPDFQGVRFGSVAEVWVPTSIEAAEEIARGQFVDYTGEYFKVGYYASSVISADTKQIAVNFGAFLPDNLTISSAPEVLSRLSVEVSGIDADGVSLALSPDLFIAQEADSIIDLGNLNDISSLQQILGSVSLSLSDGGKLSEISFDALAP